MDDLKKQWEQTGKSLVIALTDLGSSLYSTVKAGLDKANDWARTENVHYQPESQTTAEAPASSAQPDESQNN